MYIKQDYDYNELEQFISEENKPLYNLIKEGSQQDDFVFIVEEYNGDGVTVEDLNKFMYYYKDKIITRLGLNK